jgi:uncharacterized membrane protein
MAKSLIYSVLNDDELLRISNKIKEKEMETSGEICLSIKEQKKFFDSKKSIRELAEKEFLKQGVYNTVDKTGILIFILLKEREFYILADEGINSRVKQSTWDDVRTAMADDFKKGEFAGGLVKCIDTIGNILKEHFPIKPGDKNELSNRVVIR